MTILQRQFINDTKGIPIGVILPLEEYNFCQSFWLFVNACIIFFMKRKQLENELKKLGWWFRFIYVNKS
jgi:hypothetical protein